MEMNGWIIAVVSVCVCVLASGDKCNNRNCNASNGSVCNDKGVCDCGVCKCEPPYKGPTCEECPTCPNPCEMYSGCVGCKIFGTGPMGIMECIAQCDYMANYIAVDKTDFDTTDDGTILCSQFNEEMCMESFRIGGMSQGYRDLYVRTEMDCEVPIPTTSTTLSVIDVGTVDANNVNGEENDVTYKQSTKEKAGVVSGSGKITDDGNNAALLMPHHLTVLIAAVFSLLTISSLRFL